MRFENRLAAVCRCGLAEARLSPAQSGPFPSPATNLGQSSLHAYHDSVLPLQERSLITRIGRRVKPRAHGKSHLAAGIGDDCAVIRVPAGHETLVTTDFSLEGVHFRRDWHPAEAVGHRCLARGLSDIAAMGGQPIATFLSLALAAKLPQSWIDEFLQGLLRLAGRFGIELAGGDIAESRHGVLADIVVLGSAPRDTSILRSGTKPGERIYVSGELGGSAAALDQLRSREKLDSGLRQKHFFPEPRISVGRILRERKLASSMIDVSDGLSTDLFHICEESGVGAEISAETVPRAETTRGAVDLTFALHGGEDYELLFTSGKQVPKRIAGVKITEIGRITRGRRMILLGAAGKQQKLCPLGWEHFRP